MKMPIYCTFNLLVCEKYSFVAKFLESAKLEISIIKRYDHVTGVRK